MLNLSISKNKHFRVEQQKNSFLMEMNDVKQSVEELTVEKVSHC